MFAEAEADPSLSRDAFKKQETRLRTALVKAQYARLEAAERALVIVVAGIDGAGKGATVNLLNEWMDPRHIVTQGFGLPDERERQYPPLWRYWNALPAKGRTAIVFGSWYAPLLFEGARKHPDTDRLDALASSIRHFEEQLSANGVQLLKLWFHLSPKAQKARSKRLLASPETAWQVLPEDLLVQRHFDRLRESGHHAISRTDSPHAPWVVIPSADDNMRAVAAAQAVLHALQRGAIRVPAPGSTPAIAGRRKVLDKLDYRANVDKDDYENRLGDLQGRLARAMRDPAFRQRSLVLAFEGQDAAGKGGAIRRVTQPLDARHYEITPVAAPSPHELSRPYLWRFWRRLPRLGRVAIFDRSWYGRVLVERVEELTPAPAWKRAYGEINDFEAQLVGHGAIVLKFWLAISEAEQLKRFREREKSPYKTFKITPDDWRNRRKWPAYLAAANDMIARTDTMGAPWHVIATDDKRLARLQVLEHIVETVEKALGRG
ncbi:polyphosphate:AMP phosphotransferase [Achromobacter aloeverae]|uniref:Polyphosphate:AMP phosphotransferase n=1 Tax=Achromobacter aloeverae TaxID=1750518 RepID=A0A4Q1HH35_9BURK|nr:polyphosphate:AMP phosphotransferase [Achromobacter aloeverae]RXN86840.1 polyphosphate:AMP phosphotransferase [Achromobacter aloeverae]